MKSMSQCLRAAVKAAQAKRAAPANKEARAGDRRERPKRLSREERRWTGRARAALRLVTEAREAGAVFPKEVEVAAATIGLFFSCLDAAVAFAQTAKELGAAELDRLRREAQETARAARAAQAMRAEEFARPAIEAARAKFDGRRRAAAARLVKAGIPAHRLGDVPAYTRKLVELRKELDEACDEACDAAAIKAVEEADAAASHAFDAMGALRRSIATERGARFEAVDEARRSAVAAVAAAGGFTGFSGSVRRAARKADPDGFKARFRAAAAALDAREALRLAALEAGPAPAPRAPAPYHHDGIVLVAPRRDEKVAALRAASRRAAKAAAQWARESAHIASLEEGLEALLADI